MINKAVDIYTEIFGTNHLDNYEISNIHYRKLKEVDKFLPPSDSFFLLINSKSNTFDFVSSNFECVLGFSKDRMLSEGKEFWFSLIHPDDLKAWLKLFKELIQFTVDKVQPENRPKLVYIYNYRVKNSKGKYINLHAHLTPLEFYDEKPILSISHYSVLPDNSNRPVVGVIKILNDNNVYETLYHKNYSHTSLKDNLSKRERDIVRLLAINMTSKEIGEKLFISPHTVDKHRRNILKKLNFKSTGEIIQYCKTNPLF